MTQEDWLCDACRWAGRNGGCSCHLGSQTRYLRIQQLEQLKGSLGPSEIPGAPRQDELFSRDAIAKIENGTRRPKASTLRALCQALNCEPRDLLPD
jgi:transcriptional regulator with XRE-family HTH domain